MNIYGENCHRCRRKTRRIYKHEPTCGHCIAVLESRHETKRKCPIDSIDMKKEIIQNIILDRCPKCSGIWFDSDELESFQNLMKQLSNQITIHKIIKDIVEGKYEE